VVTIVGHYRKADIESFINGCNSQIDEQLRGNDLGSDIPAILQYFKIRSLSYTALSKILGVHHGTVARWAKGERSPKDGIFVVKITAFYNNFRKQVEN